MLIKFRALLPLNQTASFTFSPYICSSSNNWFYAQNNTITNAPKQRSFFLREPTLSTELLNTLKVSNWSLSATASSFQPLDVLFVFSLVRACPQLTGRRHSGRKGLTTKCSMVIVTHENWAVIVSLCVRHSERYNRFLHKSMTYKYINTKKKRKIGDMFSGKKYMLYFMLHILMHMQTALNEMPCF